MNRKKKIDISQQKEKLTTIFKLRNFCFLPLY